MKKTSLSEKMKATQGIRGKIPLVLLWFLGVPIPILLVIFLLRGCT
jgi:hypothetical protein